MSPGLRLALSRGIGAFWLCLAVLAAPPAWGQTEGGPDWNALSPIQQQQLAPLREGWSGIDGARREKWLNLASRLEKMDPKERQRIQRRMSEWASLPDGERTQARQRFQEARRLSLDERQARWREYQALSPEQQRALANQAAEWPERNRRTPEPLVDAAGRSSLQHKHNTMPLLDHPRGKVVAPGLVQARPGATTNTVSKSPQPMQFQQSGLPKIAATPEFVDPATLLPRRGAQAAATAARPGRDKDRKPAQ